jgi:hypothetical protein
MGWEISAAYNSNDSSLYANGFLIRSCANELEEDIDQLLNIIHQIWHQWLLLVAIPNIFAKNKEDSTTNMLHNVYKKREYEWGVCAGSYVATML